MPEVARSMTTILPWPEGVNDNHPFVAIDAGGEDVQWHDRNQDVRPGSLIILFALEQWAET
jgi:hypothetical protein